MVKSIMVENSGAKPKIPVLYLMIGIPGSGKSTWAVANSPKIGSVVPLDKIRREIYGYFPSELNERLENEVWITAFSHASNYLNNGRNVILDSMALTRAFRGHIFTEVDKLTRVNYIKVAVYLSTPLLISLERNRIREKFVEEKTIRNLAEALEPPEKREGFERILVIE